MTFCVQRYINLHEFGHLLLFFLEYVARIGRAAALSVPFSGLADAWAVVFSKYKTRGKSENYPEKLWLIRQNPIPLHAENIFQLVKQTITHIVTSYISIR